MHCLVTENAGRRPRQVAIVESGDRAKISTDGALFQLRR